MVIGPRDIAPTSVRLKSEINDALPPKRHQTRHAEFCAAHLLSSESGAKVCTRGRGLTAHGLSRVFLVEHLPPEQGLNWGVVSLDQAQGAQIAGFCFSGATVSQPRAHTAGGKSQCSAQNL